MTNYPATLFSNNIAKPLAEQGIADLQHKMPDFMSWMKADLQPSPHEQYTPAPTDSFRYTGCALSRITVIIGSLYEPNMCSIRLIWCDRVTEKEWASR